MKKFSRRELFKGAGAVAVGGTALALGLKSASSERVIIAGSRVGKSFPGLYPKWTPTIHLRSHVSGFGKVPPASLRLWQKIARDSGFPYKVLVEKDEK